ncbi:MAG: hypothetical protein CVV06_07415 [Gammaproteobacteria bacterium HGW-Gammaproteobacteria-10]|nr:MAG: hypothetical protein CVV06_07415 [Gammaproteobacteria bacterium HGW-Gammaproteobacteria-10]
MFSRFYFGALALRLRYRCSFFGIIDFDDRDLGIAPIALIILVTCFNLSGISGFATLERCGLHSNAERWNDKVKRQCGAPEA